MCGLVARILHSLNLPLPIQLVKRDLKLGAAKFGHFVEDVGANLGFGSLVLKAARFQFGADDHLPAAHLRFYATALIGKHQGL